MSQMFFLVCAVSTGVVVGTLPGVRECLPWGQPPPPPPPQMVMVTPAPTPGSWIWNKGTGPLDQRSYDRRSGPGAAVIYSTTPRPR